MLLVLRLGRKWIVKTGQHYLAFFTPDGRHIGFISKYSELVTIFRSSLPILFPINRLHQVMPGHGIDRSSFRAKALRERGLARIALEVVLAGRVEKDI